LQLRTGGAASADRVRKKAAVENGSPFTTNDVRTGILTAVLLATACSRTLPPPVQYSEVANAVVAPADERIAYGTDPLQFGELRVPDGDGPFPIAVVIHGGCWQAEYDLTHAAAESEALRQAGMAVWSIEYRRIGDAGGGWPGTLRDVAAAVDFVAELAARNARLDSTRVVLIGHSAGGHLALWSASRQVPSSLSDAPVPPRMALRGVVSLAGITDLRSYGAQEGSCNAAVPQLMGGSPDDQPARYATANPIDLVPLRAPVHLIHGEEDAIVPISQSLTFAERNRTAGGEAVVKIVEGAGHFDVIAPQSRAFREVIESARTLLR
jgi:acetyl esterase/lipase